MKPLLTVANLSRHFPGAASPAVNAVSFDLEAGEILALIGPSGCGKTTTLRMVAGFETPDTGTVCFLDRDITHLPPERRQLGMVFQDYALFPHMNIRDNVLFGAAEKTAATADKYLRMVGLEGFDARFPDALSGGQQQRAALARSLAAQPKAILLDEPFSNLDSALRQRTRLEMRNLLKAAGVGVIMVTHDQEEALSFADRVAVMRDGRILQSGTGQDIYDYPADSFVAGFVGRTNLIKGDAKGDVCDTVLGTFPLAVAAHGPVILSIRPEALQLSPKTDAGDGWTVAMVEFLGPRMTYWIERDGTMLQADVPSTHRLEVGAAVTVVAISAQLV